MTKNERNSINKNSLLKVINGKSLRIKSELVFLYEKQNLFLWSPGGGIFSLYTILYNVPSIKNQ